MEPSDCGHPPLPSPHRRSASTGRLFRSCGYLGTRLGGLAGPRAWRQRIGQCEERLGQCGEMLGYFEEMLGKFEERLGHNEEGQLVRRA
eukprot:113861-Rhodomonas_salina.2